MKTIGAFLDLAKDPSRSVAAYFTILSLVLMSSTSSADVAGMIAQLRACKDRLAVDAVYATAVESAARGDVRVTGRLVSRMIDAAYDPALSAVSRIYDGMEIGERAKLSQRTRLDNFITEPLPRNEAQFRDAHSRLRTRPARIMKQILAVQRWYISNEHRLIGKLRPEFDGLKRTQFKRWVLAIPAADEWTAAGIGGPFSPLPTNVTGYGAEFSRKLVLTGRVMNELLKMIFDADLERMASIYHDVLLHETARGHDLRGDRRHAPAGVYRDGIREGILSVVQTITLLMAERIPGFEDPSEVLRLIATDPSAGGLGLINTFAIITPGGFIGPMSLGGQYLPGLLRADHGILNFNPEIKSQLITIKQSKLIKARETMTNNCFAS